MVDIGPNFKCELNLYFIASIEDINANNSVSISVKFIMRT